MTLVVRELDTACAEPVCGACSDFWSVGCCAPASAAAVAAAGVVVVVADVPTRGFEDISDALLAAVETD